MNGPNNMYRMRPNIKLAEEIDLPNCMYKMKVIQNSHYVEQEERFTNCTLSDVISQQVLNILKKPMPEVVALENRQEEILAQLSLLKLQLHNLREQLKQSTESSTSIQFQVCDVNKNLLVKEVVVKANPKWPPYSLLALNCLLQNSVNITNNVHSSISTHSDSLKYFEKKSNSPLLNIRLIWKDVSDTEFLTSPTTHTVMAGEVNLLRYLSRTGPSELNYEASKDPIVATAADELLDICYKLVKENTKARQLHLRALNQVLQKSLFLMGDQMSVVDIAGWSALKHMNCLSKDLPASVNKWFENCNKIFAVNGLL